MRPLLPVLLAFMAGILLSGAYDLSYGLACALFGLSIVPAVFLYLIGRRFSRLVGSLPFLALGALFILPYQSPELPANHIVNFVDDSAAGETEAAGAIGQLGTVVEGVVASFPEPSTDRTRFTVDALRLLKGGQWVTITGKVRLTVLGDADGIGPGDEVRFVGSLARPWNFGNPGEFDYRGWLAARKVYVTGFVKKKAFIVKLGTGGPSFERYLQTVRGWIGDRLDKSGAANIGLIKALSIGERGGIDPGVEEAFKRTGTAHILAISGIHIGIVAAFSYAVFLFLLKRSGRLMLAFNVKKAAALFSFAPALAYALVSGFSTSTQRAVVMAVAFILTFVLSRGRDYVNTLCLAALFILAVSPHALYEAAFQLTFAAVMGIAYIVPRLKELTEQGEDPADTTRRDGKLWGLKGRIVRKWVATPLFTTVAAGLATAPIIAWHFHRATLVGLAANMAAVPLGATAIPLLLLAICVMPFSTTVGLLLVKAADMVLGIMAAAVKLFSALPFSSLWVSTPTFFEIALFYGAVFMAVNIRRGRVYAYAAIVLAVVFTGDMAYWRWFNRHEGELRVTFISVGQGDSALVEFPGGKTMLIDGGGTYSEEFDTGGQVVAPLLWKKKIRRIDYMVLSHSQLDHMGGMSFIAESFSVGEFWWNGEGRLGKLKAALSGNGVKERVIKGDGESFYVGDVFVDAFRPYIDPAGKDLNNMSLVVRLRYGERGFLFTGDMAGAGEAALVEKGGRREITADVLKAPHHGSRYSSSWPFLERVAPSLVVVSAGRRNPFGFPHGETLERYAKAGAKVLRTDEGGAIIIKTDGRSIAGRAYLTDGVW